MKFAKTSENCCVVTELKNVRKHPNADKLMIATVLGESIIVGLDSKENDKVLYFDSNLYITPEYCSPNNLYSHAELNKDVQKKGFFGNNGRVRPVNLRGEKSYGFVASIDSLGVVTNTKIEDKDFPLGLEFNIVNDIKICDKYVVVTSNKGSSNTPKLKKKDRIRTNMFPEHWDTKQLKREIDKIPGNQVVTLELKVHGTSGRIGNVLAIKYLNPIQRLLNKFGMDINTTSRMLMNGTRRVNLTRSKNVKSFYKGDMRDVVFNKVKDNVRENEQLYFEIAGYDTNGSAVQKDFPYGCKQGEHIVILYRITINTSDGKVYDMSRDYVYRRAEELGLQAPHVFEKYYYDGNIDKLMEKVNSYTDGPDPIDPTHIREGVVVWFMTKEGNWSCLKNKSFEFLKKEDAQKEANIVDIEDQN
jgi:tRNA-binding EMAP/Myf-like protein